ncbi:MAG: hypothetical protein KJ970_09875 [Candidatus Eisenbacteria bacterium]|uniref:Uncharacterized protein n=1 Tax=Eiseniibacteriota bacterium TaxID=2212470 RepID=A0A948W726_UNCEI|nr:hypothetical protein [Candidatus Eisenbacteria bacterium]MBU1947154.1 hypothetical protein [Candidatus Eisenbacteria bacterium]MBU2691226.1 hypothetical protein [Candidatus Eisenbacteria bacterium]
MGEFREILSKPTRSEIVTLLKEFIRRRPGAPAARQARLWLLEDAIVGGDWNRLSVDLESMDLNLFPTDSTLSPRLRYLISLSQFKSSQRDTAFTSSSFSAPRPNDRPRYSWDALRDWIEIRKALDRLPDEKGLRPYLEWEGAARATGFFGLWMAGLSLTPEGSRARKALGDLIQRHGRSLTGSLEGVWLERTQPRDGSPQK